MLFQVALRGETFGTGLAFKGALPSVRPLVDDQVRATLVGPVAPGESALVLGKTYMRFYVFSQVLILVEGTLTAYLGAHFRLCHALVDGKLVLGQVRL